jgi:uncharacterized membrane protein HdeD (DUF308 family)
MNDAVTSLSAAVKKSHSWSIAIAIFMILAGLMAIFLPPIAGIAVTVLVGWLLIVSGCFHLFYGWHTRSKGSLVWELIVGVVYILAGIFLLVHPVAGLATLTLALAVYLFAEGVLELVMGFTLRPHPGWGWLLFDGILTLLVAFMIWRTWPFSAPWVIGTLVGISMLFSGTSRLMLSMGSRRLLNG